ncbi:hypothetical protein B0T19DRAFT_428486 [Cercophora scortea]|uniref:Uncharacterized protein n=1 Tax=Cercophora scortea TaxID=314031 RepID=A0AAE0MAC2_9PEZI|nr:hypothetical protein B0T19DRAFT_428486 [Cercophora scortea]
MAFGYLHGQGIASTAVTNPLIGRETAPSPTTGPVSQFTPAASCGLSSDLYAVSKSCFLVNPANKAWESNPSWLSCTAAQLGQPPDMANKDCYQAFRTIPASTDTTFTYPSGCPVGYTGAVTHSNGYTQLTVDGGYQVGITRKDVVQSIVYCCPSVSGYSFQYDTFSQSAKFTTTDPDGQTWEGNSFIMPRCYATSVQALSGRVVTMTKYSDTQVMYEKRQEATVTGPAGSLITEAWDYANDKIWAAAETASSTVFADGYTCYAPWRCDRYFSGDYVSQNPNVAQSSTTSSAMGASVTGGQGGTVSTISTNGSVQGSTSTAAPSASQSATTTSGANPQHGWRWAVLGLSFMISVAASGSL